VVDSRERSGDQLVGPQGRPPGRGARYYSVFSLGPIIVIAIAIAGVFFSHEAVTSQVTSSLKEMLGDNGAKAIEAMLAGASRPAEGALATILGIGALLFAAIGVVVQLKDALNVVWEVEESEESGLWHFGCNYVLSFAAVLALGFLLLVSLLVTAALAAAGKFAAPYMPEGILHVVSMLVSFAVVTVLFAMMFKWLPDVSVAWRDVWLGAFLTALFFEIGKAAIGFYIGKQGLESTYGAAASIVVLLIWVYYTSQIVLMGAVGNPRLCQARGFDKAAAVARWTRKRAAPVAAGRTFRKVRERAF